MSLVGNFAFGNNDRQAHQTGVPSLDAASPHNRRPEPAPDVSSDSSTLGPKKNETRSRRKASTASRINKPAIDEKTSSDREKNEEPFVGDENSEDERRGEKVAALARRLTEHSTYSVSGQNPFTPEPDSTLDPNSPHFSPRAWAKAMLQLQSRDPKGYPLRTAGVAFRNLNVHGFGSATDYQKSVGNVILEGVGLVKRLIGSGQRKIDILQNLDGLVESGEMLVVLGPPGSGCSTFLKTISGETHGFVVDSTSQINYQGRPRTHTKASLLLIKIFSSRHQRQAHGQRFPRRGHIHS